MGSTLFYQSKSFNPRNSLRSVVLILFIQLGTRILGKLAQPIMRFYHINNSPACWWRIPTKA